MEKNIYTQEEEHLCRGGNTGTLPDRITPSQKKEAFLFRFNKAKYEELKQKGFRLEF